ncbi:MAG: cytochrome c biogenesis protein CcsA [Bacteroidales bacterium]|nr:cytochrome c biogenesis protein CcsA [Bacteroidales bacterium]
MTAVILMIVFALSIAWATFIENDLGTENAKKLIYFAPWFETLLWLIAVNLLGNMFKEKLLAQKKHTIFLFHMAFLLILGGGAITRHLGFEGTMHIREGESADVILLKKTYLMVEARYKGFEVTDSKDVFLSSLGSNHYVQKLAIGGRNIRLETELYLPNATEQLTEGQGGSPLLSLFVMDNSKNGHEYDLSSGESFMLDDHSFAFNGESASTVAFSYQKGNARLMSQVPITVSSMMSKDTMVLHPGQFYDLKEKTLYRMGKQLFVVKSFLESAQRQIVNDPKRVTGNQGLVLSASTDNATERLSVINKNGLAVPTKLALDDIQLTVSLGRKEQKLPFAIELKVFILDRYPGSNSPSSFESEVIVHDMAENNTFPYRIFMNNILNYKGYRFFQSSYDQDQRGTILSVNHECWGTVIPYLGYFFMTLGMVLTLFNKQSRLRFLIRRSREIQQKKKSSLALVLVGLMSLSSLFFAPDMAAQSSANNDHLNAANELLVQSKSGRIEPLLTLSSELMRKLHKKEKYKGMSATEVVLGMMTQPERWKREPLLKISNSVLANDLNVGEYVSFQQLFNEHGYRLKTMVDEVYHKSQQERNKYDKEIIALDERVNICFQLFNASFLKLFPLPDKAQNVWVSAHDFPKRNNDSGEGSPAVIFHHYLQAYAQGQQSDTWQSADELLVQLKTYQQSYGAHIIPSSLKVKTEIFYNRFPLFNLLSKGYETLGLLLLILSLLMVFKPGYTFAGATRSGLVLSIVAFIAYTAGIVIRWYISGHAPWSNGYETLVFVGWATALGGFLFYRQSFITLAVTNLLAGIILMVAGFSWMNPEITPLVPVLKSFWLIIHVAGITSSYGFLAIGALLGFLNLWLIIFKTKTNAKRVALHISEITIITEITLIIGLLLLTVGSFLGAVWANESWGRYWGWDPKETWALITILVYSVLIHLNRLSVFKSEALFNGLALLSLSSVLMTFFGVNYYLSGMHSYAQGDGPPIPNALYYVSFFVLLIIAIAYSKETRWKAKS